MVAQPFSSLAFEPEPVATGVAPLVWVLHDGKAGMASQSLGLAEATGFPFVEKRLTIRRPWAWLPPQVWIAPFAAVAESGTRLAPPWPDLVIACGRNAARPALAIRHAGAGRPVAVQIQDPHVGHGEFDLMIVPDHDRLRRANVITTKGALHRVTPQKLAAERQRFPDLAALPRPILGVLVGGSNRAYGLSLGRLGEIADQIAGCVRATGGSVVLTPSRRTGEAGIALLRERLAGLRAEIWDGTGDNPYYAYLAVADAFLVTADSVSMVSEAAATGKPVHVIELDGGDAKFARFHRTMRDAGITRRFAGRVESWSYTLRDDTAHAGAAVRTLVLDRLGQRLAR
jgi:mitochondrial fission protein ELM1